MNGKIILSILLTLGAAPLGAQAATYYCVAHNEGGHIVSAKAGATKPEDKLFVLQAANLDQAEDAALAAAKKLDATAESAQCALNASAILNP